MSGTEHLPYYLQVVVEDSDLGVQRGPIWGIQRRRRHTSEVPY